ncbi:hypothetical protein [Serratia sp. PL7]|uniref:hypothetical protein n=1 Tax=Serratia sp. PL7 TaxID=2952201 RepID=UPI0021ADBEA8|nr:hypothetical protein [Serratia sp. PL7]
MESNLVSISFTVGSTVTCFDNSDNEEILIVGDEYIIEGVYGDSGEWLLKLAGVEPVVFYWRFVDPETDSFK